MRGIESTGPSAGDSSRPGRTPGNLPVELTTFHGRDGDLDRLRQCVSRSRLVTVTGTGGVGKSRLAVQGARQMQERFCDGVWLVDAATVRDPRLLEHSVVAALRLAETSGRAPRTTLLEQLARRRLLLVLDGFEHLVEESARLVRTLLGRLPGLRVLATGRRPLGIGGEQLFPLAPLAATDAAGLFADRAGAVQPGFALTPDNRDRVADLCRRLDGIPLALELAAGRLRTLSLPQMLERLDDRFALLTGGTRDAPAHHQTLRTAVGWSHELCSPRERLLWARLSVFAGAFDLEAAEYVCSGPELPADQVLDVLAQLLAQSVVTREDAPSGVRYRMLDTLRAYGAYWLAATGQTRRLRERHRDWYTGLVTWCELEWLSPRQEAVALRITDEFANLRAALEFAVDEDEDPRHGLYLAGTLWFCWVGCGRIREGRHWLERALEREAHEPPPGAVGAAGDGGVRLRALGLAGYAAVLQGDTVAALAALHECREEAERTGDDRAAAYSLLRLGSLALISDDVRRAEELLAGGLARYEELGELNSHVLIGRVELALAVAFGGDLARAVELCEAVRRECVEHGELWARAYALYGLGFMAWSRGEAARAGALLREGLAISAGFQDLVATVLALELLARIAVGEGRAREAAVFQGAAQRLWPSVGMPLFGSRYFDVPHRECERLAREALGEPAYLEALREGAALDPEVVVDRALRPGDGGPAPVRRPQAGPSPAGDGASPRPYPFPGAGEAGYGRGLAS
ncbi:ATP-binding protein [Streptomyces carpaticus]|uniref:AAA family ATPase n=1 Tax=Streptomyces carpaticus TaxID=285558 RepID=A0ABV4ZSS0_9ACTN